MQDTSATAPVACFEAWLGEMAARPLPGGVAAAAAAAAMGAALLAKAARVTLRRAGSGELLFQELLGAATGLGKRLLDLADADSRAFQAVLATRALPAGDPARRQAWIAATEVPLRVAEACAALQECLAFPFDLAPAAIRADLEIGESLLKAGREAGCLAAESNLSAWDGPEAQALRYRLEQQRTR